jgi:hypothetical protein
LAIFLWIDDGPQSFSDVENQFLGSTWTSHIKFKEVLKCLLKLGMDNIKPTNPTFSTEHDRLKVDCFWPHFKCAIGDIDGSHVKVVVPADEVINYTCHHGYTS